MIEIAHRYALRSPQKKFKTGAVIVQRGEIISNGWSHISHVSRREYYSVHAELHALLRASREDAEGATCYIATVAAKSGNLTSAQPCVACATVLHAAGIQNVIYTVSGGSRELILNEESIRTLRVYPLAVNYT